MVNESNTRSISPTHFLPSFVGMLQNKLKTKRSLKSVSVHVISKILWENVPLGKKTPKYLSYPPDRLMETEVVGSTSINIRCSQLRGLKPTAGLSPFT